MYLGAEPTNCREPERLAFLGQNPSARRLVIYQPCSVSGSTPRAGVSAPSPESENMRRIPTYGPEGQRRRALLLDDLLVLESRKMVVLQRGIRTGKVLSAHFFGEHYCAVKTKPKAGTKYSYQEQLGNRRRWTHSRLPRIPVEAGLSCSEFAARLDTLRRLSFHAVTLSIAA